MGIDRDSACRNPHARRKHPASREIGRNRICFSGLCTGPDDRARLSFNLRQTGAVNADIDETLFFIYLDAQKLRTPKGLDWVKSKYPELIQIQLMTEMQALRTIHCTLWAEGVRELVSAEKSDVKYIKGISNHFPFE